MLWGPPAKIKGMSRCFWGLQGAGSHAKVRQPESSGDLVPFVGYLTSGLSPPLAAGFRLKYLLPFFSEALKVTGEGALTFLRG